MQSAPTDKLLKPPRGGGISKENSGFLSAERCLRAVPFTVGSELARAVCQSASKLADLRNPEFLGVPLRSLSRQITASQREFPQEDVASLASPTASPHIAVRFGGRAGTIDWMTDDAQLLRQFTDEGSQAALAELVRRRIDFVYATALRQVGGDAHLAQDVTQSVFLALARSARSLARRQVLTG